VATEVFVDTGAWYAVQVVDDRWHGAAAAALTKLVASGVTLVTTSSVVGETYTLLRMTHHHAAAIGFLDRLAASARVLQLHADQAVHRAAVELLRRFDDQDFSYVDAVSFVVMKRRRNRFAFAFDAHFATAGFIRIPVDQAEP
jgi:predicted nucleic acid-binding protein